MGQIRQGSSGLASVRARDGPDGLDSTVASPASGLILPGEQRKSQFFFNAFLLGLGFIAFLVVRRSNRLDNALLNTSITGSEPAALPSFEVNPTVRDYLADRLLVISALFVRAFGEIKAKLVRQPDGDSVLRGVLNRRLRQGNLWARLEPAEAELAAMPMGDWSEADCDFAIVWAEQLRLLRWVFYIDDELLPLDTFRILDELAARGPLINEEDEFWENFDREWGLDRSNSR